MKPISSPHLDVVLPIPQIPAYLLLDYRADLFERLYSLSAAPGIIHLFQDTVLQELMMQGPVLLPVSSESEIYQAYSTQPEDWPGLLLFCEADMPRLLASLRRCLLVRFAGIRRAVFRYYDPRVASYFFPACTAVDLDNWFNPLQRIVWHGGTWSDEAEKKLQWHGIILSPNGHPAPPDGELQLTESQERALAQMDCERFVWNWCEKNGTALFSEAMKYLREGFSLGFEDAEPLAEYLRIRASHPQTDLPAEPLLKGSDSQRLNYIQKHMEGASDIAMEMRP